MDQCQKVQESIFSTARMDGDMMSHIAGCASCQKALSRAEELKSEMIALREDLAPGESEVEQVVEAVRSRVRRLGGGRKGLAGLSLVLGAVSAALLMWLVPGPLPAGVEERLVGLAEDVGYLVTPTGPSEQVPYELVATGAGFLVDDFDDDSDDWPGGYEVLIALFENENGIVDSR
jgi:hypothetical protein